MSDVLTRVVGSRRALFTAVAVGLVLTGSMYTLFIWVVADAVREDPGPPDLPARWSEIQGGGGAPDGPHVVLLPDGVGTVDRFPYTPEGLPCRTENYVEVDEPLTWRVSERGSVIIMLLDQEHTVFPAGNDGERDWSKVRIDVCGSERQGGDWRTFIGGPTDLD